MPYVLLSGDEIPTGRYPSYVLYLEMDVAAADVNVHPTKHEVRFKEARNVHDFIFASLRNTLHEDAQIFVDANQDNVQFSHASPYTNNHGLNSKSRHLINETSAGYRNVIRGMQQQIDLSSSPGLGRPVTQLQGRIMVTVRDNDLLLVDIHAIWRYIARVRLQQSDSSAPVHQRPLLVPFNIKVSQQQAGYIEKYSKLLRTYGLTLDLVSETSIIVRTIPTILQDADIQALIVELLELLGSITDGNALLHEKVILIFEKHVCEVASESMTIADMIDLLRMLETTGIDIGAKDCPGIWKTMNTQDVAVLISRNG